MQYSKITTSGTTVLKKSNGSLGRLIVSGPGTTWTIQIFDSDGVSGTPIFGGTAVTVPAAGTVIVFDLNFNQGLTVVTAGGAAGEITITWA